MIVHSVVFGENQNYERMSRVLEYSIGVNSPSTPFVLHRVTEPDEDLLAAINQRPQEGRKQLYLDNARKMKHQCRIVQEAQDGEVLCLLDADTMVLGDLAEIEMQGADLVVTHRPPKSTYPMNSGTVFLLVNGATKHFFGEWLWAATKMLSEPILHSEWKNTKGDRPGYGGVNQAAFGYLTHEHSPYIGSIMPVITEVPCAVWNCENECLKRELFSEQTKVVHIHGNLRKVLFNFEQPYNAQVKMLADRWREFEKQALGVAA